MSPISQFAENCKPAPVPPLRQFIHDILYKVDGVLALRRGPNRIVAPHLFIKEHPEELANLAFWPTYAIPEALEVILRAHPGAKLVIVCRGCEEARIVEVFRRAHLNMDHVDIITLQCKPSEVEACGCVVPFITVNQGSGYPAASCPSRLTEQENPGQKLSLKMRTN